MPLLSLVGEQIDIHPDTCIKSSQQQHCFDPPFISQNPSFPVYTVRVKWSFLKTWKEFFKSSAFSDPKFYLRGVRYDARRVHIPNSSEVILKEQKVCFYEQSRLKPSYLFTDQDQSFVLVVTKHERLLDSITYRPVFTHIRSVRTCFHLFGK